MPARTHLVATAVVLAVMVSSAFAHTVRPAVATAVIQESGAIELQIRANLEVMLAGIGPEYTDTNAAPNAAVYDRLRLLEPVALMGEFADLGKRLVKLPLLTADGVPVALEIVDVRVPPVGDIELARDSTIALRGQLPSGAQSVIWAWPADYGSSVIRFSRSGDAQPQSQWLQAGQSSDAFAPGKQNKSLSRLDVIRNYLAIGFEHIVPKGLDHILFVVGLFLFSYRLKPLLLQVTAFTVAHTITLGLSIYGVISLPASIVEPLIALSIAYVGFENCVARELKASRIALVFGFGLLHGLGFAGVLTEIGLPRAEFLTALISFNIGVELGQLAVITICLVLFGWCRGRPWYRQFVVVPGSLVIAVIGLYWTWIRIFS